MAPEIDIAVCNAKGDLRLVSHDVYCWPGSFGARFLRFCRRRQTSFTFRVQICGAVAGNVRQAERERKIESCVNRGEILAHLENSPPFPQARTPKHSQTQSARQPAGWTWPEQLRDPPLAANLFAIASRLSRPCPHCQHWISTLQVRWKEFEKSNRSERSRAVASARQVALASNLASDLAVARLRRMLCCSRVSLLLHALQLPSEKAEPRLPANALARDSLGTFHVEAGRCGMESTGLFHRESAMDQPRLAKFFGRMYRFKYLFSKTTHLNLFLSFEIRSVF